MTKGLVLKSTGYAGLGDLLLALERALALAQASGRTLVVDWRDTPYSRGSINLFDVLLAPEPGGLIALEQLSPLQQASGRVTPSAWQGQLHEPLRRVYSRLQDGNWNRRWAREQLDGGADGAQSGADWVVVWDHIAESPPGPSPLAELIRPAKPLGEALALFKQRHFEQPMLGLHVRDTAEAARSGKRACPLQLQQQLDHCLAEHPDWGLFVATDNAATLAALRRRHPGALNHNKWMPTAGEPLHLAEHQADAGLQVAQDALLDIWLLAACTALIYPTQSSFSRAAARL